MEFIDNFNTKKDAEQFIIKRKKLDSKRKHGFLNKEYTIKKSPNGEFFGVYRIKSK